jgi:hypothetical protein
MKFSGRLQIEADPRNWLKTNLDLNHGRLELVSGGEVLGSWPTAQVKAERVEGDRFQLHLGDDRAIFAADDALAFSYEALPVLAKKTVLTAATGLRGKLRKGLAGAERPAPAEHHLVPEPEPEPIPIPVVQPEAPADDSEPPQPTRKLRDLIQAAVRNNMAEAAVAAEPAWRGPDSAYTSAREVEPVHVEDETVFEPATERELDAEPEPSYPVWSEPEAGHVAPLPLPEVGEPLPVEEPSVPDLPEIGQDEIGRNEPVPDRPTFDLSPIFAEPAASYETIEQARSSLPQLDQGGNGLEEGDTLGERPAEPFGWIRAAEEALPAAPLVEPPSHVVRTLDTLIAEVQDGGLTPAQVDAVSELIRAVADAIDLKNRR